MAYAFKVKVFKMDFAERRELFLEMMKNYTKSDFEEEIEKLTLLTDTIFTFDLCVEDIVDNLLESWEYELEMEITDEKYTIESIGASPDSVITEEDMEKMERMFASIGEHSLASLKLLEELREKWGNIPFVCYLELKYLEVVKPEEYMSKLEEYVRLYPNYSLIKLCLYNNSVIIAVDKSKVPYISFEDIFANRGTITNFEMLDFQLKRMIGIMARKDFNALEAMYLSVDNLEFSEFYPEYLKTLLFNCRIELLKEHFENN